MPALKKAREGALQLKFGYDPAGRITSADVVRSSGDAGLDEAARQAHLGCPADQAFGPDRKPAMYTWEWSLK
jgi:TonB family protein